MTTNSKNISTRFSWRIILQAGSGTLKGKSPYDFIRAIWNTEPERFLIDPNQFTVGLNS
jgi:hypothetical protein